MKYISIGGILTREERKALMKSKDGMKKLKNNQFFMILVITGSVKVIQGKLGFGKGLREDDFLINAQAIFDALNNNVSGFYTPPYPGMKDLENFIAAFTQAIKNSKSRLLDSAAQKKSAKSDLYGSLKDALAFVNNLAWTQPSNGAAIITGAKMVEKGANTNKKQGFVVRQGKATGEALLIAVALMLDGKYLKATYFWQYSLDGGVTWIDLPTTTKANTMIAGMTAGVPAKFRKRTSSTKTGLSKWCTAIDFTVQ